jgi:NADPH:quinone reductase-like Zn-dependent oxidoreductase
LRTIELLSANQLGRLIATLWFNSVDARTREFGEYLRKTSFSIVCTMPSMKAAIVLESGKEPIYGDFREPLPSADESVLAVTAAALSPLTKGRASGTHYSSAGTFPFVAGVDGVGKTDGGRRVYFVLPTAPFGAMAEKTIVRKSQCVELPQDLDDVTAAAIANPGMSSWAALKERALLRKGETVLINGATGSAGSLAVQIAKYLGARKVIVTGRNAQALENLRAVGADVTIPLTSDDGATEEAFKEQFAGDGVDVVLDYLWGPSAEKILIAGAKAGKEAIPIRFVQIGSASAGNITLPGAVLRSSAIQLMGSGIGSVPLERLVDAIAGVLRATVPGGFKIATKSVPLAQLESAWSTSSDGARTVFTLA